MFEQIEFSRVQAGIDQKELCARARVHETTYTARKNGRSGMSERTLLKLKTALDALIDERRQALDKIGGAA
ncbi:helix-turn-helix domain-containing protein [Rhizobium sp. PAMB 3182]